MFPEQSKYEAAQLDEQTLLKVQQFEEQLNKETDTKMIVIAYEEKE